MPTILFPGYSTDAMVVETFAAVSPRWAKGLVPKPVVDRLVGSHIAFESLPSFAHLQGLMSRYRVNNLVNVDAASFKQEIDRYLALEDYNMEGYADPEVQRDLSVKFAWGHNHDFGDFSIRGHMGNRHIALITAFVDLFNGLPLDLHGKRVLDVGCWSGGTSLILCAMGAEVVAIEEVKKYVDCLNYLKHAFGLDRLHPRNLSLYDCTADEFHDAFDYVLFGGVLYHLTDPILGLRITFDALKTGGSCLFETAVVDSAAHVLVYGGPKLYVGGSKQQQNRGGWNWFIPSVPAVRQMLQDVGYEDVVTGKITGKRAYARRRVYGVARKRAQVDMTRAGLSVRNIR